MKVTQSKSQAIYMLLKDEYASWSYEGAKLLVEYLEEIEEATGKEIEFDAIALRCQFEETKEPTEEERNFILADNGEIFIINNH